MRVENSAGRFIETNISGKTFKPFSGAKKYTYSSKITSLSESLSKCGIKDGMTLSFHHQLRNGDFVINKTLETVQNLGIKNIMLAQTAMFNVHNPIIDFIKNGVVNRIEGSINGVVGDYISRNPLPYPVVLRSHGGRWAAIHSGEIHVDIAIIASSASDERGNSTGILGKSAFGPISYSQVDAMNADNVIVVTDNVIEYPCKYQERNSREIC